MRFKQYLIEDRKVERARRKLSDDEMGYYFNVTDKTHKDYESTKFVRK